MPALGKLVCLFALTLPGCNCEREVFTKLNAGPLSIAPSSIDFGQVPTGFDVTRTFTLENEGELEVTVAQIESLPADGVFDVEGNRVVIEAGTTATLVLHFRPGAVQTYEAAIKVTHNGINEAATQLLVKGEGISPFRCEPCDTNPTECFDDETLISYALVGGCENEQCLYEANQMDCECGCDTNQNKCVPCEEDAGDPVITSIDGDGSELPTNPLPNETLPEQAQEAVHRIREQLIVQGENLDAVVEATLEHNDSDLQFSTADTLSFAEGRTAMQIKINLPQDLVTGLFTLSLIGGSTAANADVYLLQGEPGAPGATGQSGSDGLNALITSSEIAPGDTCAQGGLQVETGLDTSRDGILQSGEITQTQAVCNSSAPAASAAFEPQILEIAPGRQGDIQYETVIDAAPGYYLFKLFNKGGASIALLGFSEATTSNGLANDYSTSSRLGEGGNLSLEVLRFLPGGPQRVQLTIRGNGSEAFPGNNASGNKSYLYYVRIGDEDVGAQFGDMFELNGATVTDSQTHRDWATCALGQEPDAPDCLATAGTFTFCEPEDALCAANAACAELNDDPTYGTAGGWRVPRLSELNQIISCNGQFATPLNTRNRDDHTCSEHDGNGAVVVDAFFPDTPSAPFWTAESYDDNNAWAIDFSTGEHLIAPKDSAFHVRCVQGP